MIRLPLYLGVVAVLHGASVLAQSEHTIDGWQYVGCVSAKSSEFSHAMEFIAPFSPEECQVACSTASNWTAIR
jgi:hypothetical protein